MTGRKKSYNEVTRSLEEGKEARVKWMDGSLLEIALEGARNICSTNERLDHFGQSESDNLSQPAFSGTLAPIILRIFSIWLRDIWRWTRILLRTVSCRRVEAQFWWHYSEPSGHKTPPWGVNYRPGWWSDLYVADLFQPTSFCVLYKRKFEVGLLLYSITVKKNAAFAMETCFEASW